MPFGKRATWMTGITALATASSAVADAGPFHMNALPGFRLINPSYRASGDDLLVSVLMCRLNGFAGASPGLMHIERAGADGAPDQHHDVRLGRVGLRSGENCQRVTARFGGKSRLSERIKVCLAYTHKSCGPDRRAEPK